MQSLSNKLGRVILAISTCFLIGTAVAANENVNPGMKGSWKVIACQLNERWLPDSIFREFRYNIDAKNHFTIDWSDLSYPQFMGGFPKSKTGQVAIDTTVTPNTIDLIPDSGPFKGKTFKGIIQLDHDILRANFAFPGKPRPTIFDAQQGEVYEVWQRIVS